MSLTTYPGLLEFIADKAEITSAELQLDQTLETINLDSLTLIEISLYIEREYGLNVPEGDLRLDQELGEWVRYLDERIG
ncbi:acyl carrier protein [Kitasatospora sp. LaBMicrA B282]|uniref:acyl carrier protein n=1 Tax=Kitasatospora sp. LaBMicrA B282 TaxID=3420949 RepID=UPI003D0E167A